MTNESQPTKSSEPPSQTEPTPQSSAGLPKDDNGQSEMNAFGKRITLRALSIAVALALIWWAFLKSSYPLIPVAFIIGVSAGLLRFKLHLSEIQDQLNEKKSNGKFQRSHTMLSGVKGSIFRYGIAFLALLIAGLIGKGWVWMIVASAVGLLIPNIALITDTIKSKPESEPDN